jgi:hypothetical protein
MKKSLPKHISEALQNRRDKFICELEQEGFNLNEISSLLEISTQRVWQIVLKNKAQQEQKV